MNPFTIMSAVFFGILIFQMISVIKKKFWREADALVTDSKYEIDINGCVQNQIYFQFEDRMIYSGTLEIIEEFSDIGSTLDAVKSAQKSRGIIPNKKIKLYYNPRNPKEISFHNCFNARDHSQIVVWSSVSMISLIIGLLI